MQLQLVIEPFERWELDFVVHFNRLLKQKSYILVFTNYGTKWVEVVDLPKSMKEAVIKFLFELFI